MIKKVKVKGVNYVEYVMTGYNRRAARNVDMYFVGNA